MFAEAAESGLFARPGPVNPDRRGGKVAPRVHLYRGRMTLWRRFCISHAGIKILVPVCDSEKVPAPTRLIQRKCDTRANLLVRAAIYPGVAEADIQGEMILHLPYRAQKYRSFFFGAEGALIIDFGDRTHRPVIRTFDNQARESSQPLITCQLGGDIEMDAAPVPAPAGDAGPFQARAVVGVNSGKKERGFCSQAPTFLLLQAALLQNALYGQSIFNQTAAHIGKVFRLPFQ